MLMGFMAKLMDSEDNTDDRSKRSLWNILAQDYCQNELHDPSCKTRLFMPMQCQYVKDNDKMLQFRVQMLDTHGNDAFMKWMIAMPVQ